MIIVQDLIKFYNMDAQKLDELIFKQELRFRKKNVIDDLTNEVIYQQHARLIYNEAQIILKKENKKFIIDETNKKILEFLTYYFNGCKKAENVFKDENYKIHKNLLICGEVGVGKTILMQIFSSYLKLTNNPNYFENLSTTQMINYYQINNHLDKYTYNEGDGTTFEGKPFNICMNDVGIETQKHFGTETNTLMKSFLHARNELWELRGKFAHITTNLSVNELKKLFEDNDFDRINDRFKTYNVIYLPGQSKR